LSYRGAHFYEVPNDHAPVDESQSITAMAIDALATAAAPRARFSTQAWTVTVMHRDRTA
jgi:hypothetical protein